MAVFEKFRMAAFYGCSNVAKLFEKIIIFLRKIMIFTKICMIFTKILFFSVKIFFFFSNKVMYSK